ncbi:MULTISPECIES: YetF domain-containing protein [Bacillus]|uniref:YetF domain-containing protein n=1 Tax=Bacillus TaxID=1386 RepID=UPI0028A6251B|nr:MULTISPECIES: YetF domain-containing protein [Bacillus]
MSILKKSTYQKTIQEDINLAPKIVHIPVTIIRDGELLKDELWDLGKNEAWLKNQLKVHKINEIQRVFIAEWLEGNGLLVQTFDQVCSTESPADSNRLYR